MSVWRSSRSHVAMRTMGKPVITTASAGGVDADDGHEAVGGAGVAGVEGVVQILDAGVDVSDDVPGEKGLSAHSWSPHVVQPGRVARANISTRGEGNEGLAVSTQRCRSSGLRE